MRRAGAETVLSVRVPSETKAKFQYLAAQYHLTESGLLRRLVDQAVEPIPAAADATARTVRGEARADRLYVRLYRDDRQLLAERAAARNLPSATYLAVLARVHLRQLTPLPEPELKAFERGVAALSAIGRYLNQIARRVNQDSVTSGLNREDLAAFIQVATALHGHFKTILKANKASWEVGYETDR
jgi:predicted transcriptional regulator